MISVYSFARRCASAFVFVFLFVAVAFAQTTTFTYQGRIADSGGASGTYDLQFSLYNKADVLIGTITRDGVPVTSGVFTVQFDFGAAFPGAERTLEIGVRRGNETTAYTTLAPRQRITSTPYAIRALSAAAADTATTADNLSAAGSSNFVGTNDSRLSDSRADGRKHFLYSKRHGDAARRL